MLDYRIYTFLKLYETMNYHRAAKELNLSQPAVTQHIRALEREYASKLFIYDGKRLIRTPAADMLAVYARSGAYNDKVLRGAIADNAPRTMRIGATKTIGEFVIGDYVTEYLCDIKHTLSLTVDNTQCLLKQLDDNMLDFAIVEGFFDKDRYDYELMRREPFIGICEKTHPFANRAVDMEELFSQTLILREKGSGTRAIFEQILSEYGYSTERFARVVCINNFALIAKVVAAGEGISFVYRAIAQAQTSTAQFTIHGQEILREFNYVYLKNSDAKTSVKAFLGK